MPNVVILKIASADLSSVSSYRLKKYINTVQFTTDF